MRGFILFALAGAALATCPANQVINGRQCYVSCGQDRQGGDYANAQTNSFQACIDACAKDSRCQTAQYHNDNGFCYFKNQVNPANANSNVDSVVCGAAPSLTTCPAKTVTQTQQLTSTVTKTQGVTATATSTVTKTQGVTGTITLTSTVTQSQATTTATVTSTTSFTATVTSTTSFTATTTSTTSFTATVTSTETTTTSLTSTTSFTATVTSTETSTTSLTSTTSVTATVTSTATTTATETTTFTLPQVTTTSLITSTLPASTVTETQSFTTTKTVQNPSPTVSGYNVPNANGCLEGQIYNPSAGVYYVQSCDVSTNGMDIGVGDAGNVPNSLNGCADLCQRTAGCIGSVFTRGASIRNGHACFLKSGVQQQTTRSPGFDLILKLVATT